MERPPSERVHLDDLLVRVQEVESLVQRLLDLQGAYAHQERYTAAWEKEHGLSPNVRPKAS